MISLHSVIALRKTARMQVLLTALSWILGLLSAVAAVLCQHSFSMMYPFVFDRVSIVGMIASLVLPIILSYILINRCNIYFALPVLFLKAFLYMCCYYSISVAFGSAGWLVRALVLFSDSVSVVILLFFFYMYVAGDTGVFHRLFRIAILALLVIGCLDYYVISPFILMLLNY